MAQTRELECTKVVVPQVVARGRLQELYTHIKLYIMSIHHSPGLKVVEVAHDMQLAVGRYVKQDLKLLNSFDTWHGMKVTAMVLTCMYVCIGTTIPCRNQECCQGACQDH